MLLLDFLQWACVNDQSTSTFTGYGCSNYSRFKMQILHNQTNVLATKLHGFLTYTVYLWNGKWINFYVTWKWGLTLAIEHLSLILRNTYSKSSTLVSFPLGQHRHRSITRTCLERDLLLSHPLSTKQGSTRLQAVVVTMIVIGQIQLSIRPNSITTSLIGRQVIFIC